MNPRCNHHGSSCTHRRIAPQALPYHATWVDHAKLTVEVVLGPIILLVLLFVLPGLLLMVWS